MGVDDDIDFDAVMRQMGVNRRETRRDRKPKPKAKASRPQPPAPPKAAKAKPERAPPPARRPDSRRPRRATPRVPSLSKPAIQPSKPRGRPSVKPSAKPQARSQDAQLIAELKRLQAEVVSLRADAAALERVQSDVVRLEGDLAHTEQQNDALTTELAELRAAHDELRQTQAEATPSAGPPSGDNALLSVLESIGVVGDSEAELLIRALDEAGRLSAVLGELRVLRPERARRLFDENTALLGDCGKCPAAAGRAVLRVPRARCQVCGGSDIQRAARRFVSAALAHGIRRVTVVGGSPKYHRQLREVLDHHRLKLRMVQGDARIRRREARDHLRGSDLTIIWGATILDHSTSEPYTTQAAEGRLISAPHRGIVTMLDAVAARLSD